MASNQLNSHRHAKRMQTAGQCHSRVTSHVEECSEAGYGVPNGLILSVQPNSGCSNQRRDYRCGWCYDYVDFAEQFRQCKSIVRQKPLSAYIVLSQQALTQSQPRSEILSIKVTSSIEVTPMEAERLRHLKNQRDGTAVLHIGQYDV